MSTTSVGLSDIYNKTPSSSTFYMNLDYEKLQQRFRTNESGLPTPVLVSPTLKSSPQIPREPWTTSTSIPVASIHSRSSAVNSKSESPQSRRSPVESNLGPRNGGFRLSKSSSEKLNLLNKSRCSSEAFLVETQALTDSLQKDLLLLSSTLQVSESVSPFPTSNTHSGDLSSTKKLEACSRALSGIATSIAGKDQLSPTLMKLLSIISEAIQSTIPLQQESIKITPKKDEVIDISEPILDDVYLHRSTSWLTTESDSQTFNTTCSKGNDEKDNKDEATIRPERRHASSSDNSYDGFRSFLSSTDSFNVDNATHRTSQTARVRYGRRSPGDGAQSWKSRDSSGSMASFDSGVDDVVRSVAAQSTSSILGRTGMQISTTTTTSRNATHDSPNPSASSPYLPGKRDGVIGGVWNSLQSAKTSSSFPQLRRNSMPASVPGVPRLVFTNSESGGSSLGGCTTIPQPSSLHSNSTNSNSASLEKSLGQVAGDPLRRPKLSFQDEFVSMLWNNPEGEMSLTWRELLAELPNTTT